ncbi:MAG: hypothetical protein K6F69_02680 [Treponema sp.]|nr:hypothetical protein [Treponema sp.]
MDILKHISETLKKSGLDKYFEKSDTELKDRFTYYINYTRVYGGFFDMLATRLLYEGQKPSWITYIEAFNTFYVLDDSNHPIGEISVMGNDIEYKKKDSTEAAKKFTGFGKYIKQDRAVFDRHIKSLKTVASGDPLFFNIEINEAMGSITFFPKAMG